MLNDLPERHEVLVAIKHWDIEKTGGDATIHSADVRSVENEVDTMVAETDKQLGSLILLFYFFILPSLNQLTDGFKDFSLCKKNSWTNMIFRPDCESRVTFKFLSSLLKRLNLFFTDFDQRRNVF